MSQKKRSDRLLVLGLGNVLCADDGLGVVAVAMLRRQFDIPDNVGVLDGGTLGLALLHHLQDFDDVILVDAIRADGPPGSFVRLQGDEVAPAVRDRLSVHQIGVADLLDALHWLDAFPRRLVLLGLVPETLRLELARSAPVETQIPHLVERVAEEAERLGYRLQRKHGHATTTVDNASAAARALGL